MLTHTVYRAIRKRDEGDFKNTSHKAKSKYPRHIEEEKEQMVVEYRKKTELGKGRLRYYIFQKEGVNISESTIGKVIKRAGPERKRRRRLARSCASPSYCFEKLFLFKEMQVAVKEMLDKETLTKEVSGGRKSII